MRKIALLLRNLLPLVVLLGSTCLLTGCDDEDEVGPSSGSISVTIGGRSFTNNDPVVTYSSGNLNIFCSLDESLTRGYLLGFNIANPRVGTITGRNGLTGQVCRINGSIVDCEAEYELTRTDASTVTISKFDENGAAEGTFSFVGRTDNGQTLNITNGRFRVLLTQ
jgi:hypothetical protein